MLMASDEDDDDGVHAGDERDDGNGQGGDDEGEHVMEKEERERQTLSWCLGVRPSLW